MYSLRALYGADAVRNALHGSDSLQDAEREIRAFFPHLPCLPTDTFSVINDGSLPLLPSVSVIDGGSLAAWRLGPALQKVLTEVGGVRLRSLPSRHPAHFLAVAYCLQSCPF